MRYPDLKNTNDRGNTHQNPGQPLLLTFFKVIKFISIERLKVNMVLCIGTFCLLSLAWEAVLGNIVENGGMYKLLPHGTAFPGTLVQTSSNDFNICSLR